MESGNWFRFCAGCLSGAGFVAAGAAESSGKRTVDKILFLNITNIPAGIHFAEVGRRRRPSHGSRWRSLTFPPLSIHRRMKTVLHKRMRVCFWDSGLKGLEDLEFGFVFELESHHSHRLTFSAPMIVFLYTYLCVRQCAKWMCAVVNYSVCVRWTHLFRSK